MHQLFKFILLQNATSFGHLLCPSSGVLYCTFGTGKFHAGLMTSSKQSQGGTLHVSGIFSAHHQEFSAVQSALVSFMQV
jgi:glycerol kinase